MSQPLLSRALEQVNFLFLKTAAAPESQGWTTTTIFARKVRESLRDRSFRTFRKVIMNEVVPHASGDS